MIRTTFLFAVAVTVLTLASGRSSAQPPVPGVLPQSRPAFSPYLNLTRRDIDPAVNYYGLVRPQVTTATAIRSLQQQIQPSEQAMTNQRAVDPSLPITGQPTYFLNTGGYFLNSRTGLGPRTTTQQAQRPTIQTTPSGGPIR